MDFIRFSLMYFIIATGTCGCTLSFNNIATEGQASDVLEERECTEPKINAVLKASPIPL